MKLVIPEHKKLVFEMTMPIRWGDMDSMGHVTRALCQVISNSPAAVPAGADVFAAVDAAEPAGKLTSATVWPLTGQTVGLGLLRRELAREGWDCWIGNERIPATVRVK